MSSVKETTSLLASAEAGQAPPKQTLGKIYYYAVVIALSSFMFGYIPCITNGALVGDASKDGANGMTKEFGLTTFQESVVVSITLVSAMLGAGVCGAIANGIGRLQTTRLAIIPFAAGSLIVAFASNYYIVLLGRFIAGLSVGAASVFVTMYCTEIAPAHARGTIALFNQLFITIGILVAFIVAFALQSTEAGWRWMCGLAIVPAAIQLILTFVDLPESPRWLMTCGKQDKATAVLKRCRVPGEDISAELAEMSDSAGKHDEVATWRDVFAMKKQIIIGIVMCCLQQLSGINAVMYYSSKIFASAGVEDANLASMLMGTVNVAITILSVVLVDKTGRKILLTRGMEGMVIMLALIGVFFMFMGNPGIPAVLCTIGYVIGFGLGLGPIPYLLLAEVFDDRTRGKAMSLCMYLNWLCNFIVSISFLSLIQLIGGGTSQTAFQHGGAVVFWIFLAIVAAGYVFTRLRVPETKGLIFSQITSSLERL